MAGTADAGTIEVIVRHAIRGNEIRVVLPSRARFRHVKTAVSRLLDHGDDLDFMESGVLLHKNTGVYTAYRERERVGDVRKVLVCNSLLGRLGDAEMVLDDDEVSDGDDEEELEELERARLPPVQIDPELVTFRPPPRPARKSEPTVVRSAREVLTEKAKKQLHLKAIQKDVRVVVREAFMSDNAEGEEVQLERGQRGRVLQVNDPQEGFALVSFAVHRQPQWVYQTNFHRLGLAEEVREGVFVLVREDFPSDSETGVWLKAGLRGKVTGLDDDGDATLAFDVHDQEQWVNRKHFDMLQVVSGVEREALSRDEAFSLQSELHDGFCEQQFQQDLEALQARRKSGEVSQGEFGKARQALFMRVQGLVLPKYGFEASGLGVIKMMGEMGPFVKDPELAALSRRVNMLLGLEMPTDKLQKLTADCGTVSHCRDPDPLELLPPTGGVFAAAALAAEATDAAVPAAPTPTPAPAPSLAPATLRAGARDGAGEWFALPEERRWPAGEPPPVKVFIVGSWDGFKPTAMRWEAGRYEHLVQVGAGGSETFQLRRGRSIAQTIYPSVPDASVYDAQDLWDLRGPDDRGQKKFWKIGKHPEDKAAAGDSIAVRVLLDLHGNVAGVHWTRC